MSIEELPDIVDDLSIEHSEDGIRIRFGDSATNWIACDDEFIERISPENLNRFLLQEHLRKEIEIRNVLDEGYDFLENGKYAKAIACFDEAIYYDDGYSQALIGKSHALYAQGHFVKALRFYRKSGIDDVDYYRLLLRKSSEERDGFPKIKRNIYAGDEAAAKGDYGSALDFYERALVDPSKFKNKILYKLLNKKAFILIRLSRFDEALASFDASIGVRKNDPAYYGRGFCQYNLGLDCVESLDKAIEIDKKFLLEKALIFNDLKLHERALACFDEFLDSHFRLDGDFKMAVRGKVIALDALGMDSSREREMLV